MAGVKPARTMRGKYSSAGYNSWEEDRQMYIADVPAGSAQDELRDYNRVGYRSERPWQQAPIPAFEGEAAAEPIVRPKRQHKRTFFESLAYHASREKKDFGVCVVLFALILMMMAAWGQQLMQGAQIQESIKVFQDKMVFFRAENDRMKEELAIAKDGERIRNLAQNELNMLRRERAQHETIYIRMPEKAQDNQVQYSEEPRMELLDILLGLLNVFHIGE